MSTRRIGGFVVHDQLGRGGTGVVNRAWDEPGCRWVAIKSVRKDRGIGGLRCETPGESYPISALDHPAIARVHEVLSDGSCDHIVMELVAGRPLSRVLDGGPLTPRGAVAIASQIADGLDAAHGLGIIHGDLKLQNIMVTDDLVAKILDFGIGADRQSSRVSEPEGRHDVVIGTACAMSPEQAMGRPIDPRSDLFSLGALVYQMVTGVHPFLDDDPLRTMENIAANDPRPANSVNPAVPEPLSELIHELLEKNPDDRPQSAGEVVERLRRIGAAPR